MSNLNCPYCDAEIKICHDDGFGYDTDKLHEYECPKCEKKFVFSTYIEFSFTPHKADCLNGGEHEWNKTRTYPKEYSRMKCGNCDEEREPTEEEWKEILSN